MVTADDLNDLFVLDDEMSLITLNVDSLDLDLFPKGTFNVNLQLLDQFEKQGNNLMSIFLECSTSTWTPVVGELESDNTSQS